MIPTRMKAICAVGGLLAAVSICLYLRSDRAIPTSSVELESPQTNSPPMLEGTWMYAGRSTKLLESIDQLISIDQRDDKWFLSVEDVQYHGVKVRKPPTRIRSGPFELRFEDQVLSYEAPYGQVKMTCRFNRHGNLVMPAVVRKDNQTWWWVKTEVLRDLPPENPEAMLDGRRFMPFDEPLALKPRGVMYLAYMWRCESDPFIKRSGTAEFFHVSEEGTSLINNLTYRFVERPTDISVKGAPLRRVLEFHWQPPPGKEMLDDPMFTFAVDENQNLELLESSHDIEEKGYGPAPAVKSDASLGYGGYDAATLRDAMN